MFLHSPSVASVRILSILHSKVINKCSPAAVSERGNDVYSFAQISSSSHTDLPMCLKLHIRKTHDLFHTKETEVSHHAV